MGSQQIFDRAKKRKEKKKKKNTIKLYYYHQRKLFANPNSNCVKEINKSKITLAPRLPTNRDFLPSERRPTTLSKHTVSLRNKRWEKSIKESNVVEQNRKPVKLRSKYSPTKNLCSKPGLTKYRDTIRADPAFANVIPFASSPRASNDS